MTLKIFEKIKNILFTYKKNGIIAIFCKTKILLKQYGFKLTMKAFNNKVNARPLLLNVSNEKFEHNTTNVYNPVTLDKSYYTNVGYKIFLNQQSEFDKTSYLKMIHIFKHRPGISIVIPLYNPPIKWLKVAINSILKQIYEYWELILVDDGSKMRSHFSIIDNYAKKDGRIKFIKKNKNDGISVTTNIAINHATNDYIALMDQDDEITYDCLFWFAYNINKNPDADFFYSDECKIKNNRLFDFFFKPNWSPYLLYSSMYIGHMTVYKKSLIEKNGYFRKKYDFSQDYDFALRASDTAEKIVHIERILYFWRSIKTSAAEGGKDFARKTNILAHENYIKSKGIKGKTIPAPYCNYFETKLKKKPLVSIIIPSDNIDNIKECITNLLNKTNYANTEIIVVTSSNIINCLKNNGYSNRFLKYDKKFNFSDKCNCAAKIANGEFLVFYNDDVCPKNNDWLDKLLDIAVLPNVASVSPCCIFENDLIQYAGMHTNTIGLISTSFISTNFYYCEPSPFNHRLVRNVSVLSGACSIINKRLFEKVGGFDAKNTPNGHSDVALSFKFINMGYSCVYNPFSLMIHLGNHTWHAKQNEVDKSDIYMIKNFASNIAKDNFYTDSQKIAYSTNFKSSKYSFIFNSTSLPVNAKSKNDALFVLPSTINAKDEIVIENVVKKTIKNGYFITIIIFSNNDKILKLANKLKIPLIIYEDAEFDRENMLYRFEKNYDFVFVYSLLCYKSIEVLQNQLPKVLWWIPESTTQYAKKMNIPQVFHAKNIFIKNDSHLEISNTIKFFLPSTVNDIAGYIETHTLHDIYKKNKRSSVLLISHEMSYSGAPNMLLRVCKILSKNKYDVEVWSLNMGGFEREFRKEGFVVKHVKETQYYRKNIAEKISNFNLVICNTCVTSVPYNVARKLVPTIWYIHESLNLIDFNNDLRIKCLSNSRHLFCVSNYANFYIKKYYSNSAKIIPNGIEDAHITTKQKHRNLDYRLKIFTVGTIERRKNFYNIIEAINALPNKYKKLVSYTFAGRTIPESDEESCYFEKMINSTNKFIKYIGQIDPMERNKQLLNSNIVIVPSLDDSSPLPALESMMMGRPVIVSKNTGTVDLIKNGYNGWIVPTGDVKALSKLFIKILKNRLNLDKIGQNARNTYLKYATYDLYTRNILKVVSENINNVDAIETDW